MVGQIWDSKNFACAYDDQKWGQNQAYDNQKYCLGVATARGVAMGQARQAIAWGPVFWGGPQQLTIWTIGNVIINNIHVTWSNISASPLGGSLLRYTGCFLFPRDAFPNWHSIYSCIYSAILKMKRTYPSGSQKRKKARKGGKEETWQW